MGPMYILKSEMYTLVCTSNPFLSPNGAQSLEDSVEEVCALTVLVEYGALFFTKSSYSLPVYCLQCKLSSIKKKKKSKQHSSFPLFHFLNVLCRIII